MDPKELVKQHPENVRVRCRLCGALFKDSLAKANEIAVHMLSNHGQAAAKNHGKNLHRVYVTDPGLL